MATIRWLEVKMAPGRSIYALKVGQSVSMARRQYSHVQNLTQLPHHHQLPPFFSFKLLSSLYTYAPTQKRIHVLIVCACLLIENRIKRRT